MRTSRSAPMELRSCVATSRPRTPPPTPSTVSSFRHRSEPGPHALNLVIFGANGGPVPQERNSRGTGKIAFWFCCAAQPRGTVPRRNRAMLASWSSTGWRSSWVRNSSIAVENRAFSEAMTLPAIAT